MPQQEDQWLKAARQADEGALAAIYDTFSPALYRYAYRLLGDEQTAEDIVAETFFRFLRSIGARGGPEKHLQAYLYRVAHNLIVDRFRRHPIPDVVLDWESIADQSASENPESATERVLNQTRTRQALWKLTPDQRQVIVLKFFEGLSNHEVAQIVEKPVGAVKSLQHRALNALRRMLSS